jgi:glycosyltransferase involved in cell wall biosynthesis
MRIAVNARFLMKEQLEGFGHYSHEILSRITTGHPDDSFDFYFDRRFADQFMYGDNVYGKVLFPPARHPVLFYLWNQLALRNALHRTKPDIFFSPDSFMPLRLNCPSVITVHDVAYKPYPQGVSRMQRLYYEYYMPRFLREAKHVITVSEFSKQEILKYFDIDDQKISVVYNGIGAGYQSASAEMQQAIRTRYTRGLPYFLFVGAIHPRKNVAGLIDAYSEFRKRHDQKIALLIAGRKSWKYQDVDQAIARSPYRDDIIISGYVPVGTLAQITAGATALCYLSYYEGFGLPVAEAMASGVPVIVSKESAHAEVAGPAGLQVDPLSIEEIVVAMWHVVSDPVLRESRIAAGLERSKIFSWDRAADRTYELIIHNS